MIKPKHKRNIITRPSITNNQLMVTQKDITIVIVLVNDPHFTELCLSSLEQFAGQVQSILFVADKINAETIHLVQTRLPLLHIPSSVVMMNDDVFGLTDGQRLLSTVIRSTKSSYIILSEGDCLFHPNFVQEHCLLAQEHCILTGKNVEISSLMSSQLSSSDIRNGFPEKYASSILIDGIFGQSSQTLRGIYLRNILPKFLLQRLIQRRVSSINSLNFSMPTTVAERLLLMNGFADEQTLIRNAGLRVLCVTNLAIAYHLNPNILRRLLLTTDVFEKVLKMRYSVQNEYGLQPARALLETRQHSQQ